MSEVWILCVLLFCPSVPVPQVLAQSKCKISIKRQVWGEAFDPISKKNVTANLFTLNNCGNVRVHITSYGASITSIFTPDNKGNLEDIVLGFDDIKGKTSFSSSM